MKTAYHVLIIVKNKLNLIYVNIFQKAKMLIKNNKVDAIRKLKFCQIVGIQLFLNVGKKKNFKNHIIVKKPASKKEFAVIHLINARIIVFNSNALHVYRK